MPIVFALAGLTVGFALGHPAAALLGALLGFLIGAQLETRRRLTALERALAELLHTQTAGASSARAETRTEAGEAAPADGSRPQAPPPQVSRADASGLAAEPPINPVGERPRRAAALPGWPGRLGGLAWEYLTGGNVVVRVGVLVLFFGVAFLLRYAAERVDLSIELRLSAVALGGLVMLALGWRLRSARFGYGLVLQGGGVGVWYLTVFAAFRLYALVPPSLAFAILVGCAALSVLIALAQDSRVLAVFGVAGGFLAPVLASTGEGSHVALFSYYLILNASILAIAWFRAWRMLNVVGFVFTFIIASVWGYRFYQPSYFATTEPFLVLFLLLYVAIAILFAAHQPPRLRGYVDGTLVFGTPLIAFGLQVALVSSYAYGLAWSALALGGLYLVLGRTLLRRRGRGLRTLAEAFLATGVAFATLAVPLGLDARWTSATWALEGAAILWIGVRQARLSARLFGGVLQLGAGASFVLDLWWSGDGGTAFLNAWYLGTLILACAGLFGAFHLWRHPAAVSARERLLVTVLFTWGVLWWLDGGVREVLLRVPLDYRWGGLLIFLAGSAAIADGLERRLPWPLLRQPALALLPALALAMVIFRDRLSHPFEQLGYIGWPAALAAHYRILYRLDDDAPRAYLLWLHAGGLWLATLVVTWELAWAIEQAVRGVGTWELAAWGLVPALILFAVLTRGPRLAWPIGRHIGAYLGLGAWPVAIYLWLWVLAANIAGPADPAPLSYLPLLNPLDVAMGSALAVLLIWLHSAARTAPRAAPSAALLAALLGAGAFLWVNAVLIRTMHHWGGVAFTVSAMEDSVLVQAGLTLLWSVIGMALMLIAAQRSQRPLWFAGAGLMAVVLVKLFLLDLSATGTVERIVAFLAVGLLLLIVGYFAPAPPRGRREDALK